MFFFDFFFFQAEDGIRDWSVTGVQTCALPISALFRRGAAQKASGAMTDTSEGLLHGGLGAGQHPGGRPHTAGYQYRLANGAVGLGQFRMPRREGACGAFAMHQEGSDLAVHPMLLALCDVMANIVDQVELCLPSE